jgi:hypothetical protein
VEDLFIIQVQLREEEANRMDIRREGESIHGVQTSASKKGLRAFNKLIMISLSQNVSAYK